MTIVNTDSRNFEIFFDDLTGKGLTTSCSRDNGQALVIYRDGAGTILAKITQFQFTFLAVRPTRMLNFGPFGIGHFNVSINEFGVVCLTLNLQDDVSFIRC